jgi:DNA excision repair protein ERCC-8
LISTSYDTNLLLTSITPASLIPAHTFPLQHAIFTHAISPLPSHSPLIAAGTASPAIRLLDLRSGLATHALPGHNGAIYALSWSPKQSYILASGAADGRVLLFDIRRANAAFASLDHDDAIGSHHALLDRSATQKRPSSQKHLNFSAQAHTGPVTSVQWSTNAPSHDKLITAGHDQRIRIWDASTLRNELVHFGPRLKNTRRGTFGPLLAPNGTYSRKPTQEVLLWANDDAKGEIGLYALREGDLRATMNVGGTLKGRVAREKEAETLRARSRVNAMVWREGWDGDGDGDGGMGGIGGRDGLELVTAHADGTVGVWRVPEREEVVGKKEEGERREKVGERVEGEGGDESGNGSGGGGAGGKKRKRQDFSALVEGLSKIRRPA